MQRIHHILVATDFAQSAARAVELAIDVASKFEARLTLLYVLPPPPFSERVDWLENVNRDATKALRDAVAGLQSRYPNSEGDLVIGNPWEEILVAAADRKVDLIMMGTHGRQGLARALLGSVAEKVVRMSPIPVLTVRGE